MKRNKIYLLWLFALALTFAACEKNDAPLFDGSADGAYFDYGSGNFKAEINYANHIVGDPQEVAHTVRVRLLGYLKDEARSLAIKTKPVEDYEDKEAEVVIPEVFFSNKEYLKEIDIMVKRPPVEKEEYAVCLYLDGSGDLGTGIDGQCEYIIYVKELYEKPEYWSGIQLYLGGWTKDKHKFIAKATEDNLFYEKLNPVVEGYVNNAIQINADVVNTLLATAPGDDYPSNFSFPLLYTGTLPEYARPYFWDEAEQYLGEFSKETFCDFINFVSDGAKCDTKKIQNLLTVANYKRYKAQRQ